ncbi:MAG: hypothetical protein WC217_00985 [Candidatus Paceibacterota bacterium]|jgi:hypothetical protein
MNNNLIIGILAAILIIGGGVWLLSSGGTAPTEQVATETGTDTNTPPQTVQSSAAPQVTTGTLIVATNSTAVVTGKVTPNGGQTSYWYEYGKTASLGARTSAQIIGSGYASISAPAYLTNLGANTAYSFRLVAQNSFGTVNGDILSFTTNNNPPVVGNSPTITSDAATLISRTSANLNGRVNPNNSETSYWFEYGDSNNLGNTTSLKSAGAGAVAFTETTSVSNLAPATKYYFRINAQNQFGTVNGTILVFTTAGPAAATTAKAPSATTAAATNITTSTAKLNGAVNPNGDSTSYWFEYGTDVSLNNILGSTLHSVATGSGDTPVNVSIELTGVASNTTYAYRLVSTNTFGTVRGNIVTFKTKR